MPYRLPQSGWLLAKSHPNGLLKETHNLRVWIPSPANPHTEHENANGGKTVQIFFASAASRALNCASYFFRCESCMTSHACRTHMIDSFRTHNDVVSIHTPGDWIQQDAGTARFPKSSWQVPTCRHMHMQTFFRRWLRDLKYHWVHMFTHIWIFVGISRSGARRRRAFVWRCRSP